MYFLCIRPQIKTCLSVCLSVVPTPGHLDSLCVPIPGNLPIFKKKCECPGVSTGGGGGWALLELTDALHVPLSLQVVPTVY